jgi:hypothetical protein
MHMNKTMPYRQLLILPFVLLVCACSSQPAVEPTLTHTPTRRIPTKTITSVPTNTPSPTATITSTSTTTPVIAGPEEYLEWMNPLTGLMVENKELLQRHPVMIKVSNFPREGRPHAGLSNADIVFDYYIGEGTNRFLALFYGEDSEKVGPIRSGRLVDAQLVRMYQGILGYAGADQNSVNPTLINQLGNRAITQAPKTCPALCDVGDHSVFSVFADTSLLTQYYNQLNGTTPFQPELSGLYFNSSKPTTGVPAASLTVKFNAYNISQWQFDDVEGNYLRWIEKVDANNNLSMIPLIDRNNNELIYAENVILLFAPYTQYAPTLHDVGLWYNWNGQRAVLFRDGLVLEGVWKFVGTDRPLQFFTETGESLALKPGKTWIIIGGLASTLEESDPGHWTFQFYLP